MTDQHRPLQSGNRSEQIIDALQQARETRSPVYINGGGSKQHLMGRNCDYTVLDVSEHRGIVDYQPQELVITARAGTPLVDIIAVLAAEGQGHSRHSRNRPRRGCPRRDRRVPHRAAAGTATASFSRS